MESTTLQWNGDVDLNDGKLQDQYKAYRKRLDFVETIDLNGEGSDVACELTTASRELLNDLDFIHSGTEYKLIVLCCIAIFIHEVCLYPDLTKTNATYSEKQKAGKSSEKILITLAWKVKELTDLNERGRRLLRDILAMVDKLQEEQCDWEGDNFPRRLTTLRERLRSFVRGVTRHKRTAATHLLVFMISTEDRRRKPYALPVQCLPYKGLSDAKIRELANKVICEMDSRNMKVAGQLHCL